MPELLTESFCERCGTRYAFEATGRKRNPIASIRVFSRGFKHYIQNDDASLNDALVEARLQQDRDVSTQQLDAFHQTFNFCLSCRQYTCPNCWNEQAGRCLTCEPNLGREILPAPFPDLSDASPSAAPVGTASAVAWTALPELAGDAPPTNGAAFPALGPSPSTWPGTDRSTPTVESPQPLLSPAPYPTIGQDPVASTGEEVPADGPRLVAPLGPALSPLDPALDAPAPMTAAEKAAAADRVEELVDDSSVPPPSPDPMVARAETDDDWLAATRRLVVTPETPAANGPETELAESSESLAPTDPAAAPTPRTNGDQERSAAAAAAGAATTATWFTRFRPAQPAHPNGDATAAPAAPVAPAASVAPTPAATPVPPLPSVPYVPERPASTPAVAATGWQMVAPEVAPAPPPAGPQPVTGKTLAPESAPVASATPVPSWPQQPPGPPTWPTSSAAGARDDANLWVASSRDVLDRPGSGVQACVRCGLPLSSTARFCRRCGSRQE